MDENNRFVSIGDITICPRDDSMVELSSSNLNVRLSFAPIAAAIAAFCKKPRSLQEVVRVFGDSVTPVFTIMREKGFLTVPGKENVTVSFHKGFAEPTVHLSMIGDKERTLSYKKAIEQIVTPGDVVLDAGSGTGILAIFAAKAGAEKVYAVEASKYYQMTRKMVSANGLESVVEVIHDDFAEVKTKRKIDVLVTETFGNLVYNEGAAPDLEKCLKNNSDGSCKIIPSHFRFHTAAVRDFPSIFARASSVFSDCGIKYGPIMDRALDRYYFCEMDMSDFSETDTTNWFSVLKDIKDTPHEFGFSCDGSIAGISIWFDLKLSPSVVHSLSPENQKNNHNSWGRTLFFPFPLEDEDRKDFFLKISRSNKNRRKVKLEISCRNKVKSFEL